MVLLHYVHSTRLFLRCSYRRSTLRRLKSTRQPQLPYFQVKGDGSHAVLCLPGALGSSHTDFSPQMEYFGRKNSGYTFVGYDPIGYGYSRPHERRFEIHPVLFFETDANNALIVMKHLNFQKFSVLGWSDGGITAIMLAALHPTSVDKLVVWGSNAFVTDHDIELFEKVRDTAAWSSAMRKPLEQIYGTDTLQKLWSKWVDAMKNIQVQRNGDLCIQECKKVVCPTLIVHGAKDAMCPQFHAEYLNEHIKKSDLKILPQGKHNLHLRHSEVFNQLVHNFLSNQKV